MRSQPEEASGRFLWCSFAREGRDDLTKKRPHFGKWFADSQTYEYQPHVLGGWPLENRPAEREGGGGGFV